MAEEIQNIAKEEFELPESNISFEKAITALHHLSENAMQAFMRRLVTSLSLKQLNYLKAFIEKVEEKRNP